MMSSCRAFSTSVTLTGPVASRSSLIISAARSEMFWYTFSCISGLAALSATTRMSRLTSRRIAWKLRSSTPMRSSKVNCALRIVSARSASVPCIFSNASILQILGHGVQRLRDELDPPRGDGNLVVRFGRCEVEHLLDLPQEFGGDLFELSHPEEDVGHLLGREKERILEIFFGSRVESTTAQIWGCSFRRRRATALGSATCNAFNPRGFGGVMSSFTMVRALPGSSALERELLRKARVLVTTPRGWIISRRNSSRTRATVAVGISCIRAMAWPILRISDSSSPLKTSEAAFLPEGQKEDRRFFGAVECRVRP